MTKKVLFYESSAATYQNTKRDQVNKLPLSASGGRGIVNLVSFFGGGGGVASEAERLVALPF